MSDQGSQAVLAILREAKEMEQRLTTTALIKFLYLLDVLYARETGGKTWTGWEWHFHHFGPWSIQAMNTIEALTARSFIEADPGTSKKGDKDYILYSLSSWKPAPSLEQIGIPSSVKTSLLQYLKQFASDLARLLNLVYFHTEPMADAKPGQMLDFNGCVKIPFSSIKPVQMKPIETKASEAFKAKLRAAIEDKKNRMKRITWEGPYDEVYYKGLAELEGDPLLAGLAAKAKISV